MTIPVLIQQVLSAIRTKFYAERPVRDFKRDERALTKAISRWGYTCHQRGWDFQPQFILAEIMKVLIDIQRHDRTFQYLPTYLEGAITRSIGQRAEELHAAGRALKPKVHKVLDEASGKVVAVVESGNTETLANVFRELRRRTVAQRPARVKEKQGELL